MRYFNVNCYTINMIMMVIKNVQSLLHDKVIDVTQKLLIASIWTFDFKPGQNAQPLFKLVETSLSQTEKSLAYCARNGKLKQVKEMLRDNVFSDYSLSWSLAWAFRRKHYNICLLLLRYGAALDFVPNDQVDKFFLCRKRNTSFSKTLFASLVAKELTGEARD